MMVELNGAVPELDRTPVVLEKNFLVIESETLPILFSKSRAAAFGVLPAVKKSVLGDPVVARVINSLINSPEHAVAIVDGGSAFYYVKPTSDILPLNVRLYLDIRVPEEVGPLAVNFKKASDRYRQAERKLQEVIAERGRLLDRVYADASSADKLAKLADDEESLRKRFKQYRLEAKASWDALSDKLSALGLGWLLRKLPDGTVRVQVPLLRQEVTATVYGSAESSAGYIYRSVLRLIGRRERNGLFYSYAVSRLVRWINRARLEGRSDALIWFRPFLKFRAGEAFEVRLSLDGVSPGIAVFSAPSMPDLEVLSRLIANNVKRIFGDILEIREEDVMDVLGGISAVGESSVHVPVGIRATITFQPKQTGVNP